MTTFEPGQLVIEEGNGMSDMGIILSSGAVTFDIVWIGGSTSRYRYSTGRHVRLATPREIEAADPTMIEHLRKEAADAREERRTGARRKRGQVWPSR